MTVQRLTAIIAQAAKQQPVVAGVAPFTELIGRLWTATVDVRIGVSAVDPITAGALHPAHAWPFNCCAQQQTVSLFYPSWDGRSDDTDYNNYEYGWPVDRATFINGGSILDEWTGLATCNDTLATYALAIAPDFVPTKLIGAPHLVGDFAATDVVFEFPAFGVTFTSAPFVLEVVGRSHGNGQQLWEARLRVLGANGAAPVYDSGWIVQERISANGTDFESLDHTLVMLHAVQTVAQGSGTFFLIARTAHLQTEETP